MYKRQLLHSPKQVVRLGFCPHQRALRPSDPGSLCGAGSPCTHLQALRESMAKPCSAPRVTFPSRGKSPKARQGLRPLESPEGDRLKSETLFSPAPPAASRNPLDRAFSHNKRPICHFELVGKSVLFFPLVSSRKHSVFSIRGAAGMTPRMLEGLSYCNQYR